MTVTVQNVVIQNIQTLDDPAMPGLYYVDMRVKAKIRTASSECWITEATVSICDGGGCIDGPYPMNPDSSLGTDWYSSGVLSSWGIFSPGDSIQAQVDASEQCWSEDTGSGNSSSETVPGAAAPGPPVPLPPAPLRRKKRKKAAKRKKTQ